VFISGFYISTPLFALIVVLRLAIKPLRKLSHAMGGVLEEKRGETTMLNLILKRLNPFSVLCFCVLDCYITSAFCCVEF
jgi:hypothetical protein